VDPRDRPLDVEAALRDLADNEVILVVARDRHHNVGAIRTSVGLHRRFIGVAAQHDVAKLVRDHLAASGTSLDHENLVALADQLAGQVKADLPAAPDDDVHSYWPSWLS